MTKEWTEKDFEWITKRGLKTEIEPFWLMKNEKNKSKSRKRKR